jgi:hypothetical protein
MRILLLFIQLQFGVHTGYGMSYGVVGTLFTVILTIIWINSRNNDKRDN